MYWKQTNYTAGSYNYKAHITALRGRVRYTYSALLREPIAIMSVLL